MKPYFLAIAANALKDERQGGHRCQWICNRLIKFLVLFESYLWILWVADIIINTNSLTVIIIGRASAFASAFASCRAAASCSCLPRLVVVLPPVNLRHRNHHPPLHLPSMVGCYVLGPPPLVAPSCSLAGCRVAALSLITLSSRLL
jgi:hypothetical protein